jgi:hypothetical protein
MVKLIKDILLSFYSPGFYYELVHKRLGIGGKFILAQIVISIFILPIVAFSPLQSSIEHLTDLIRTFPSMVFRDGELSIDKTSPYLVSLNLYSKGRPKIVIDTNYKITDLDEVNNYMRENNITYLFTSDKLIRLKGEENEVNVEGYSEQAITLTHEFWNEWAKKIERYGVWMLIGILILPIIFFCGIYIMITAIICAVLSLLFQAKLDFRSDMRIAAAVSIPILLLSYPGLHGWVAGLFGLFILGMGSNKSQFFPSFITRISFIIAGMLLLLIKPEFKGWEFNLLVFGYPMFGVLSSKSKKYAIVK